MNSWDDLSIREKAEMMKVAIRNGITSLPDIKDAYNEFAEGGNLLKKGGPKKTSVNPSAQRAMRYFMDKGLTDYQAAGLVGNLMRESGMDPEAVNSSSQAYGLAQWLGSRKKALFAKYGNHPTLDNQLDFIWSELNSTHRNGLKHIKASKSAEEAARNAMGYYEFSVGPAGAIANMKKYGQDGEGSMAKGITFASRLMGQPVPTSYSYSDPPQLPTTETIPQGDFSFTPMNPQVFGMQMPSYQSPVVVPEQPIIVMAEQPTPTPEQIERQRIMQEKAEQRDALNRFGLLMSMSNSQQGNDMMGAIGMLAGLSNGYRSGGGIYIKPSHRGRFTELKERTGHSASWFKENGTPAQKKMAIFALNSRHWKHDLGGNLYEFGGDGDNENIIPWKALDNIDYKAIPDTTFTKDKTGMGSIEYFDSRYPEGITYPNGYHRDHPLPGKDVILYNPNDNDEQDIRLDALHIMPKDATYDALYSQYLNEIYTGQAGDLAWKGVKRRNADAKKYGENNIDNVNQYIQNEADGLLRNVLIEGDSDYRKQKGYSTSRSDAIKEFPTLIPYIDAIQNYLITGERPANILPEVTVIGKRKKKHGYGGNLYGGITESTQQMQTGKDYWAQLANKPTWLDTFITPLNGGQLSEVVVTPTDDESWLFSLGKYTHNNRKPLADSYTRKVVADYLSKFDYENARDYNARIKRLADAIYDTNGTQFQKNDRKNKRAYYDPNTETGKINDMNDIFSELAHPYQEWLGNNNLGDELSKGYDNDKDPRGGTRYAYPDTFEGETHGFFEPALKEWIETGKIGRSLPIINKNLSKEKIVPNNRTEVTDSAASWDRQAIDRRILADPNQLPMSKKIQYSIFDYPLLDKRKAYGGNLFDGTSQPSQQMNRPNIYRYNDGRYVYQAAPDAEEIEVSPINTLLPNPSQWTYQDADGKVYIPLAVQVDTGSITQGEDTNPLLRAANNYMREAAYRAKDGTLALQGKYTMPAIAASALLPLAGEAFAGSTIAGVPAITWANTAMTAGFAGHGLNHAINEGIDGWGDAAMTALEVTPLGRLAKPMWNAGKEGLQYAAKAADNATRYMSPSYDLYRTIGETTPKSSLGTYFFDTGNLLDKSGNNYIFVPSNFGEFVKTKTGLPTQAYYLKAPGDIDILKLWDSSYGAREIGGRYIDSGTVPGKFVSYGSPWGEAGVYENPALYEFPVGSRRGPSLQATNWKGDLQDYTVDQIYNYMLKDGNIEADFNRDVITRGLNKLKGAERVKAYRALKEEKYPELLESYDTSIYGANQTVIPNERWNFDKFLKTPFWKYSENPLSGQVQKELMMRWPEAKHLETPTIEWTDAVKTPQITAENAASEMPNIIRTVQDNGKIRLSLPSHSETNPRQFVLEPQGDNKFYVHMRTWDGDHVPANITNEEKQQLFDALYNELPEGAEILFPKSGPGYYGTRGTVAGLKRLARDSRFTPGTEGILQYLDKDGKTIKTYKGTSFIKTSKNKGTK